MDCLRHLCLLICRLLACQERSVLRHWTSVQAGDFLWTLSWSISHVLPLLCPSVFSQVSCDLPNPSLQPHYRCVFTGLTWESTGKFRREAGHAAGTAGWNGCRWVYRGRGDGSQVLVGLIIGPRWGWLDLPGICRETGMLVMDGVGQGF